MGAELRYRFPPSCLRPESISARIIAVDDSLKVLETFGIVLDYDLRATGDYENATLRVTPACDLHGRYVNELLTEIFEAQPESPSTLEQTGDADRGVQPITH